MRKWRKMLCMCLVLALCITLVPMPARGMLQAMYASIAGLRAHQGKMDIIGQNIANVNAYGFENKTTFQESFYANLDTTPELENLLFGTARNARFAQRDAKTVQWVLATADGDAFGQPGNAWAFGKILGYISGWEFGIDAEWDAVRERALNAIAGEYGMNVADLWEYDPGTNWYENLYIDGVDGSQRTFAELAEDLSVLLDYLYEAAGKMKDAPGRDTLMEQLADLSYGFSCAEKMLRLEWGSEYLAGKNYSDAIPSLQSLMAQLSSLNLPTMEDNAQWNKVLAALKETAEDLEGKVPAQTEDEPTDVDNLDAAMAQFEVLGEILAKLSKLKDAERPGEIIDTDIKEWGTILDAIQAELEKLYDQANEEGKISQTKLAYLLTEFQNVLDYLGADFGGDTVTQAVWDQALGVLNELVGKLPVDDKGDPRGTAEMVDDILHPYGEVNITAAMLRQEGEPLAYLSTIDMTSLEIAAKEQSMTGKTITRVNIQVRGVTPEQGSLLNSRILIDGALLHYLAENDILLTIATQAGSFTITPAVAQALIEAGAESLEIELQRGENQENMTLQAKVNYPETAAGTPVTEIPGIVTIPTDGTIGVGTYIADSTGAPLVTTLSPGAGGLAAQVSIPTDDSVSAFQIVTSQEVEQQQGHEAQVQELWELYDRKKSGHDLAKELREMISQQRDYVLGTEDMIMDGSTDEMLLTIALRLGQITGDPAAGTESLNPLNVRLAPSQGDYRYWSRPIDLEALYAKEADYHYADTDNRAEFENGTWDGDVWYPYEEPAE